MSADRYHSLDELKAAKKEGVDYRSFVLDRKSVITIIAPHGGFIEPGTSAIAKAIACADYNLFDFQGLVQHCDRELHVTSSKFRDPTLNKLLSVSMAAMSIHSMGSESDEEIWLGGRNKAFKEIVRCALETAGFNVNANPPRHKGEHRNNVVNLAKNEGVQLEITDVLRQQLFVGPSFFVEDARVRKTARFHIFVRALRKAIRQYKTA
jgi:phage replication-related protein YjqB (UPF0714/DUF867 family)